jgi:hypothetical protein
MVRKKENRVTVQDNWDEFIDAHDDGLAAFIKEVHEETLDVTLSNMLAGRDAMGRPWQPTQDPEDDTPLIDTGEMRRTIDSESRFVRSVPAGIFTSDSEYIQFHEFGAPDQNIPKRDILLPALEYADDISGQIFRDKFDARIQSTLLD